MTALTLEEIEPAWHEGETFAEVGLDTHALDHFGPAQSHMDTIIHPATAVIALRACEVSGTEDHLDRVIDELSQVVDHLSIFEQTERGRHAFLSQPRDQDQARTCLRRHAGRRHPDARRRPFRQPFRGA